MRTQMLFLCIVFGPSLFFNMAVELAARFSAAMYLILMTGGWPFFPGLSGYRIVPQPG